MTSMIRSISASLVFTAILLFVGSAQALLSKHECGFCHSLHGSDTSFVPRSDSINLEVLCMGCHLTANGETAPVQPHRSDGTYAEHYVTCTDCHEVHDNMPNWRLNDPNHIADDNLAGRDGTDIRPDGWPVGINTKMIGREDPDSETPYAIIITKEADYDKDGIPDRDSVVTQTCNDTVINDCYVTRKRHVIFENRDADITGVSLHAWADNNEDGKEPVDATAWGEEITDWDDTAGAPHDAICNMCHTYTSKNDCGYDGDSCTTHNTATTCTRCHTHGGCFDKGDACTKWTLPDRDLQMDTVSAAPASVNTGQTVTITADFTNLGNITELVRVKFYSSIEGYLGLTDVSDVAPGGGTGQAIFNWMTTTEGDHTVSAEAEPVLAEVNVDNNSATGNTVTVGTVDTHDVAVSSVSAPSPIQQGDIVTVTVNITNQGTYAEGPFDVSLTSDLDGAIGTLIVTTLAPSTATGVDFSWNTTSATLGAHILTGTAVIVDDDAGNNSNTTSATMAIHDVAVTTVTAPPTVEVNSTATVSVDISNEGGFTETFNVTLASDINGTIQTLSSGALAGGASTTLDFSWNTTGAQVTTHTLIATANTVSGETDTTDNSATTTSEVISPAAHDVAVDSVTAPATTIQGNTVSVSVDITNLGGVTETFDVTLASNLDGSIQTLSSGALGAAASTTLNFSWNTTGASIATHTLEAVAATVPGETITGNNSATTTSEVTSNEVHDVAVTLVDAPESATKPTNFTVSVTVENQGTASETFNVTLTSDQPNAGSLPMTQPVTLSAAGSTVLNFTWTLKRNDTDSATHTLTATADTVPGEVDTADNSSTDTIIIN